VANKRPRSSAVLGSTAAALCGAAVVVAVLTVLMAGTAYAGHRGADPVPEELNLIGLLTLVACLVPLAVGPWMLVSAAPRAAIGLAGASAATLLPYWSAWEPLPAVARAGVLAAPSLAVIGLASAVLAGGRPTGFDRRGAAVVVLAATASVVHLVWYNPFGDVGCARICADVAPPGGTLVSTRTVVVATSLLGVAACAAALVRVRRHSSRRAPRLPAAAGVVSLCALGAALGIRLWNPDSASLAVAGTALAPLSVALLGGALCLDRLRVVRTRAAVSRLVRDLSGVAGGVGALPVYFAMPDGDRWVDAAGRDVAGNVPPDGAVVISEAAGPSIALGLPPRTDPAEVAAGLSPGTRLALGNARLLAVTRWRLAELRAGQRRVVAAADAERRRIERDLHDGAQQRLVSAALHLRIARPGTDRSAHPRLDAAEEEIRLALAALRHLAHGLVPASLIDEGLEAALHELAASSDAPTDLDVRCPSRPPDPAALAAFMLVAVALGCASPAQTARIAVIEQDETLSVRIAMSTHEHDLPERLSDAADRIGAAGGDIKLVDTHRPAVTIEATIPCA
jgi:signal transduction histidine kinase